MCYIYWCINGSSNTTTIYQTVVLFDFVQILSPSQAYPSLRELEHIAGGES
jgi:hypothetical protein